MSHQMPTDVPTNKVTDLRDLHQILRSKLEAALPEDLELERARKWCVPYSGMASSGALLIEANQD